mmetsp:Transcript_21170/g.29657  ORF Transcript_21170/g.29657 Transcript_21170/m.29657 type:complete len:1584 (+) Transcript_21170:577-5328(+)
MSVQYKTPSSALPNMDSSNTSSSSLHAKGVDSSQSPRVGHGVTGPMSSMTLAIGKENAFRILEASRAFNIALNRLQKEEQMKTSQKKCEDQNEDVTKSQIENEHEKTTIQGKGVRNSAPLMKQKELKKEDDSIPPTKPSTSPLAGSAERSTTTKQNHLPEDTTTSQRSLKRKRPKAYDSPQPKMLIRAALQSENTLLTSYVCRMQSYSAIKGDPSIAFDPCPEGLSPEEMETCLLLFLDMDKSSKLFTAFEVLSKPEDDTFAKLESDDIIESNPSNINDITNSSSSQIKKEEDSENSGSNNNGLSAEPVFSSTASSERNDTSEKEEDEPVPCLSHKKVLQLFRCFLSSISTCIHFNEDQQYHKKSPAHSSTSSFPSMGSDVVEPAAKIAKSKDPVTGLNLSGENVNDTSSSSPTAAGLGLLTSPAIMGMTPINQAPCVSQSKSTGSSSVCTKTKDWTLSSDIKKEIQDISLYATECLIKYVTKEQNKQHSFKPDSQQNNSKRKDDIMFGSFGEWYNSGGYSLVPWLELLDLGKWQHAGTAPSSVPHSRRDTVKRCSPNHHAPPYDPFQEELESFPNLSPPPIESNPAPSPHYPSRSYGHFSPNIFNEPRPNDGRNSESRNSNVLISFDFAKNGKNVKITEENLEMLKNLVQRTGMSERDPKEVARIFLDHSRRHHIPYSSSDPMRRNSRGHVEDVLLLHREDYEKCIRKLIPSEASNRFNSRDAKNFSLYFTNFFSCFSQCSGLLDFGLDVVNAKELAIGFSFLCSGKKSSKLSSAFELLDDNNRGLSRRKTVHYLRSYLTMLVGISFLTSSTSDTTAVKRLLLKDRCKSNDHLRKMLHAAESEALWTLEKFLRDSQKKINRKVDGNITFADFADWYTQGGYNVAPWLEFLDLTKFLSLLKSDKLPQDSYLPQSSPSVRHIPKDSQSTYDTLFSFSLANRESLIVYKEDANYVKSIVSRLYLTHMTPEELWSSLYNSFKAKWIHGKIYKHDKLTEVNQNTFIAAMEKAMTLKTNYQNRFNSPSTFLKEILNRIFKNFDFNHKGHVPGNQLMGGMTLLCCGKKSSKLAFAFSLFDGRNSNERGKSSPSLERKELFYFLRSFLVVTFACCKQSLDLDPQVILQTSHMVTKDIMEYQMRRKRPGRVGFDEFGEWYNEGGYKSAPWLELLYLNKWVSLDTSNKKNIGRDYRQSSYDLQSIKMEENNKISTYQRSSKSKNDCSDHFYFEETDTKEDSIPPPPPEVDLGNLFEDNIEDLELELMIKSTDSHDKENDELNLMVSGPLSPFFDSNHAIAQERKGDEYLRSSDKVRTNKSPSQVQVHQKEVSNEGSDLKFHLLTSKDREGCHEISISTRRLRALKQLVTECGLLNVDIRTSSNLILNEAKGATLSIVNFHHAIQNLIRSQNPSLIMQREAQDNLWNILKAIFEAFDSSKTGKVNAKELACGFTVLCHGRKSEKLEFAFELLDSNHNGFYNRNEMIKYLQSFLNALICISSCPIGRESSEEIVHHMDGKCTGPSFMAQMISSGSSWATAQVFSSLPLGHKEMRSGLEHIRFDDFADWYTKGGHKEIPWLELLDLRKWVLADAQ